MIFPAIPTLISIISLQGVLSHPTLMDIPIREAEEAYPISSQLLVARYNHHPGFTGTTQSTSGVKVAASLICHGPLYLKQQNKIIACANLEGLAQKGAGHCPSFKIKFESASYGNVITPDGTDGVYCTFNSEGRFRCAEGEPDFKFTGYYTDFNAVQFQAQESIGIEDGVFKADDAHRSMLICVGR